MQKKTARATRIHNKKPPSPRESSAHHRGLFPAGTHAQKTLDAYKYSTREKGGRGASRKREGKKFSLGAAEVFREEKAIGVACVHTNIKHVSDNLHTHCLKGMPGRIAFPGTA